MQCTLQLLREVQIKIGLEKLESHKEIAVKALLDNRTIGLFIDTAFVKEKEFKMEKLRNPLLVRNVDKMINMGGVITHQVECNMFFKGHVERVRIDIYNLGKTKVILGMPQLAAHNPKIDWEKGEVKITRCLPICGKGKQKEQKKEVEKVEKEKNEETLRKLVPKRFWRWKKRVREDASAKSLGPCCYAAREFSTEMQHGIKVITLDFAIRIHSRDFLQAPDIIQTQDWVLLLSSDQATTCQNSIYLGRQD